MGDKAAEDIGDGMQCSEHPYRNNPGGICAFCLQEKLGKLVSSSKTNNPFCPIPQSSTSSSSPSFRSESSAPPQNPHLHPGNRTTRAPFFSHHKKKVMASEPTSLMLKRSKSVAPQRHQLFDDTDSPRKRGFWSFLHPSTRRTITQTQTQTQKEATPTTTQKEQRDESPTTWSSSSSMGRKVARSRSVGCGSRSFSGDFLERISTGLGDCTLRRVESQREAKPKIVLHRVAATEDERMKERVKCGGIFGGFGLVSSSYWISEDLNGGGGRLSGPPPHGRSKSWGWAAAFASPMRGFRPSSKPASYIAEGKGGESSRGGKETKSNTSNKDMPTIPSYLAVTG